VFDYTVFQTRDVAFAKMPPQNTREMKKASTLDKRKPHE